MAPLSHTSAHPSPPQVAVLLFLFALSPSTFVKSWRVPGAPAGGAQRTLQFGGAGGGWAGGWVGGRDCQAGLAGCHRGLALQRHTRPTCPTCLFGLPVQQQGNHQPLPTLKLARMRLRWGAAGTCAAFNMPTRRWVFATAGGHGMLCRAQTGLRSWICICLTFCPCPCPCSPSTRASSTSLTFSSWATQNAPPPACTCKQ